LLHIAILIGQHGFSVKKSPAWAGCTRFPHAVKYLAFIGGEKMREAERTREELEHAFNIVAGACA